MTTNELTTLTELIAAVASDETNFTLRVSSYNSLFDEFNSAEVISFEVDDDANEIILWISDTAPGQKTE